MFAQDFGVEARTALFDALGDVAHRGKLETLASNALVDFTVYRNPSEILASRTPRNLAENGFNLYVAFQPEVPSDVRRWGQRAYSIFGASSRSSTPLANEASHDVLRD
jgi:hypothetical protein